MILADLDRTRVGSAVRQTTQLRVRRSGVVTYLGKEGSMLVLWGGHGADVTVSYKDLVLVRP